MDRLDNSPFDLLLTMAARSRVAQGSGDAEQRDATQRLEPHWTGVGFSIGEWRFVAPLGQVTEILAGVKLTRLPRVRPWVKGVANVRGRLLPVIDLGEFFGMKAEGGGRRQRALVVEIDETYCGLLVDDAHGLKHFGVDAYQPDIQDTPEALTPFLAGRYDTADGSWTVFDTGSLVSSDRFLQAGC